MSTQIAAITIAQIALLGLVVWVVAGRLQDRARLRMEMQARMLERFASPAELKEFLESEGGRRLLGALSPRQTVAPRLLLTVQAGVVLAIVGGGIRSTGKYDLDPAGIAVMALGFGLIASAVVSWALARSWGLMPGARTARDGD
jgi:hypothetical protein